MRANEIWVSDITYIAFEHEFRFLFLITDAYSKKIVGWKYADNLLPVNAIAARWRCGNVNPSSRLSIIPTEVRSTVLASILLH